jgi:predicted nucleic acid-binding Zn ribbon protein
MSDGDDHDREQRRMSDGDDHDREQRRMSDGDDQDREQRRPPAMSRLGRGDTRRYRVLTRGGRSQAHDRYARQRRQLAVEELIGLLIKSRGLTDAMREQCVFIFWREIVGERFAEKTSPDSLLEGTLKVSAKTSSWVHEMQFFKARHDPIDQPLDRWTSSLARFAARTARHGHPFRARHAATPTNSRPGTSSPPPFAELATATTARSITI